MSCTDLCGDRTWATSKMRKCKRCVSKPRLSSALFVSILLMTIAFQLCPFHWWRYLHILEYLTCSSRWSFSKRKCLTTSCLRRSFRIRNQRRNGSHTQPFFFSSLGTLRQWWMSSSQRNDYSAICVSWANGDLEHGNAESSEHVDKSSSFESIGNRLNRNSTFFSPSSTDVLFSSFSAKFHSLERDHTEVIYLPYMPECLRLVGVPLRAVLFFALFVRWRCCCSLVNCFSSFAAWIRGRAVIRIDFEVESEIRCFILNQSEFSAFSAIISDNRTSTIICCLLAELFHLNHSFYVQDSSGCVSIFLFSFSCCCVFLSGCWCLVVADDGRKGWKFRLIENKTSYLTFHFNCIFTSHLLIKFKSIPLFRIDFVVRRYSTPCYLLIETNHFEHVESVQLKSCLPPSRVKNIIKRRSSFQLLLFLTVDASCLFHSSSIQLLTDSFRCPWSKWFSHSCLASIRSLCPLFIFRSLAVDSSSVSKNWFNYAKVIDLVKIALLSVLALTIVVTFIVSTVLHFKGATDPSTMPASNSLKEENECFRIRWNLQRYSWRPRDGSEKLADDIRSPGRDGHFTIRDDLFSSWSLEVVRQAQLQIKTARRWVHHHHQPPVYTTRLADRRPVQWVEARLVNSAWRLTPCSTREKLRRHWTPIASALFFI